MAKIRLTKNELKAQRDALKRYERYLPTLQLKKQQLQLEVRRVQDALAELRSQAKAYQAELDRWVHLVTPEWTDLIRDAVRVQVYRTGVRNVAGIDVPVFEELRFAPARFDLFATPQWFDDALVATRRLTEFELQRRLLEEQLQLIEHELRITTQRVNLFEKVKIPEARGNIRRIQIYLGDQQTSAVGRAKIAKGKAQSREAAETTATIETASDGRTLP